MELVDLVEASLQEAVPTDHQQADDHDELRDRP
jgi:hypothetical protein